MKKVQVRRAAIAAAETPMQRFERHYEKRLRELYPEEAALAYKYKAPELMRSDSSFDMGVEDD